MPGKGSIGKDSSKTRDGEKQEREKWGGNGMRL